MTGAGYESITLRGRAILWFGIALVLVVTACEVGTYKLYHYFAARTGTGPGIPWRFAARTNRPWLPSAPPLQGTPENQHAGPSEVANLREKEEVLLSTYGPASAQEPGRVHIPIREAMKLLVKRGGKLKEEER